MGVSTIFSERKMVPNFEREKGRSRSSLPKGTPSRRVTRLVIVSSKMYFSRRRAKPLSWEQPKTGTC